MIKICFSVGMRAGLAWLVCLSLGQAAEPKLDFNRDVRPILSDKCFACHGQDAKQRQADLRLDVPPSETSAEAAKAIGAGKPHESELVRRIESSDDELLMPPPKSNKVLTVAEQAILRRWVSEGAAYEKHWAFTPPVKQPVPQDANPIDYFIDKVLSQRNWSRSAEARPETWLRRVTLDLTGMPPSVEEIRSFSQAVSTSGESAYSSEVERLLTSPRYGERMAAEWLDAARYADTHGFNNDSSRVMWRWRDWVIDAFNANMPYNQFITEQLAGDLLPNPTLEQRIATGFCRNHVISSEGGIIEEEYRVEYVADRLRTMSSAWLGLTMECTRCHDHKFDPVTQKDYYSLFAFFNNVPEHGEDGRIANAVPLIPAPTKQQQQELAQRRAGLEQLTTSINQQRQTTVQQWAQLDKAEAQKILSEIIASSLQANQAVALSPDKPALLVDGESLEPTEDAFKFLKDQPKLVPGIQGQAWRIGPDSLVEIAAGKINFGKRGTLSLWFKTDVDCPNEVALLSSVNYQGNMTAAGYAKGHEIRLVDGEIELRTNDTFPAYAIRMRSEGARLAAGQWRHLVVTLGGTKKAETIQLYLDGQPLVLHTSYDGLSGDNVAGNATYTLGSERTPDAAAYRGAVDQLQFYPAELKQADIAAYFQQTMLTHLQSQPLEKLKADELSWLAHAMLMSSESYEAFCEQRDRALNEYLKLFRSLPTSMVMQELPQPRPTYILKRGAYDAHGEQVTAAVPEHLLAPWPNGAPRNRLGLAQWLTLPEHPLTARVVVNRFWAQLFGSGFVRTLEDFGFQGEYPSHPELLDWLARDFIESGWDTKRLMRQVVLSKTYRQSSQVTSEQLSDDPENRLLARFPRLRLSAEMLRDQALAISGLLRERVGGPSVYPYQPEGLYTGLVVGADYPGTTWPTSQGDDLYRRTMYTFWKRTVPHPVMLTFDAPDREFCTVRRSRTNTPLQALILMNEPGFYEAAQRLGERIMAEGGADETARIDWAFQQVTARQPVDAERALLRGAWQSAREADAKTANTVFASILMNLDETVTKE